MISDDGKIDVTGVNLETLLRKAYELSSPRGLGFFDAKEGELDEETCKKILSREWSDYTAFSTDYVHGRSVKFRVSKRDGRLYINNTWYDHSTGQLKELLEAVGLSGDLVEQAREVAHEYRERNKALAVAYLKERGGEVREDRGLRSSGRDAPALEKLPPRVSDGLYSALVDKLVTENYDTTDGCSVWRLVA